MNLTVFIGFSIFGLAWIAILVNTAISFYRRRRYGGHPITSPSELIRTKDFKITAAFMAIGIFGWLIGIIGSQSH